MKEDRYWWRWKRIWGGGRNGDRKKKKQPPKR